MVFFCFGDSITSDEVSGIGTLVGTALSASVIQNYAHGNATASDWFAGDARLTSVNVSLPRDCWFPDNVLSNQILTALRDTAPSGEPICRRYTGIGAPLLPAGLLGTGAAPEPDVIYIAIGSNDGRAPENAFRDDSEEVIAARYENLTRKGLASALRWAIETLQYAYPRANIFAATPLQSGLELAPPCDWIGNADAFSRATLRQKRNAILRVAEACSVPAVDTFARAGVSPRMMLRFGDQIAVHPSDEIKGRIADFVAGEIRRYGKGDL